MKLTVSDVLRLLHSDYVFNENELDELYEKYYYDEDVYDIERKGDILYQVIFSIGDEYYMGYQYRNDMWGSEWDIKAGLKRVFPKEITTITWITEEEK